MKAFSFSLKKRAVESPVQLRLFYVDETGEFIECGYTDSVPPSPVDERSYPLDSFWMFTTVQFRE